MVRREFTTNMKRGHGEYLEAIAVGVRMQRGMSIYFQVWFQEGPAAGAMFLLPIQALVWKPCDIPEPLHIQPWDVFSSDFSCSRIDLFHESRAYVLPNRVPGRYMMTFDFTGNELADDLEQHKHLHMIRMDDGWFAAVPNNRVLIEDRAFLTNGVTKERPDFESLSKEFRSE
jgi:hypothetical protein